MSTEPTITIKQYATIFVTLLVLLFITVGLAYIDVHGHMRDVLTFVGFTIAGVKGVLIVLYFMHVKLNTRLTWIFASAAFVWLGIMMALTLNDYLTRDDIPFYKPMPEVVHPTAYEPK